MPLTRSASAFNSLANNSNNSGGRNSSSFHQHHHHSHSLHNSATQRSARATNLPNWVLRTDANIDGDSLSYLDMMERNVAEEKRRERERVMMEEGRALWRTKKDEELEVTLKDQETIREMARQKMFGKPGHGAPTENVRKKKFTEHQMMEIERRVRGGDPFVTTVAGTNGVSAGGGGGGSVSSVPNGDDLYAAAAAANAAAAAAAAAERVRSSYHTTSGMSVTNGIIPSSSSHRNGSSPSEHDVLSFGRPGYGAPVRTKSGRIRTLIRGSPEIRFQDNESVKKTIQNSIRYKSNPELKAQYHKELEEQIRARKEQERMEREKERSLAKEMEQHEGKQWGRPGPGGTYWRGSAVTGQGFFDKMGWCGSGDPRKRGYDIRHHEAEDMKKEMEEIRHKRDNENKDAASNVGVELVPLLKEMNTGKPKKDPSTGYLMSHALPSTDVTKIADPKRAEAMYSTRNFSEEKKQYYDTLNNQIQMRDTDMIQKRKSDNEEQKRHFEQWEKFWGRPGYGAPKEEGRVQKENLMKLLHYPEAKQTPPNVELITLERLPVK